MPEKKWLNRKEACNALGGISLSSLSRMVKAGVLAEPYLAYVGRRVLVSADFPAILTERVKGMPRKILSNGEGCNE